MSWRLTWRGGEAHVDDADADDDAALPGPGPGGDEDEDEEAERWRDRPRKFSEERHEFGAGFMPRMRVCCGRVGAAVGLRPLL